MFPEAGYLCIPAVLPILKEVADSYAPEDDDQAQENQEDPTSVILGVVANIFQKIIELLARRLRKEPEEGKQVDILTSSVEINLFYFTQFCIYLVYHYLLLPITALVNPLMDFSGLHAGCFLTSCQYNRNMFGLFYNSPL